MSIVLECQLCDRLATRHVTFGHVVDRWPGRANGWYCDEHKNLSSLEIKDKVRMIQRNKAN